MRGALLYAYATLARAIDYARKMLLMLRCCYQLMLMLMIRALSAMLRRCRYGVRGMTARYELRALQKVIIYDTACDTFERNIDYDGARHAGFTRVEPSLRYIRRCAGFSLSYALSSSQSHRLSLMLDAVNILMRHCRRCRCR